MIQKSDWQSAITEAEPTTETSCVLNVFWVADRALKLSVKFGLRSNDLLNMNCLFFIHAPLAKLLRHCRTISSASQHILFLQLPPHQQPPNSAGDVLTPQRSSNIIDSVSEKYTSLPAAFVHSSTAFTLLHKIYSPSNIVLHVNGASSSFEVSDNFTFA